MVFDIARRILRARGVLTWINAFEISTRLRARTPAVFQTNRQARAAVLHAQTNRLMIEDLAGLIFPANGSLRDPTRILADTVNTRPIRRALIISSAFNRIRFASQLSQMVHDEPLANAHGLMVAHFALLAGTARDRIRDAWIHAFFLPRVAGQARRTVLMLEASDARGDGPRLRRLTFGVWRALDMRPADITLRARAPGFV